MSWISRYPAFIIMVILASIFGAVEGSALCFIFSNLNPVWLEITLGFGLLFTGSLARAYYYFKEAEPYTSNGMRSVPSTQTYQRSPSTVQRNIKDSTLLEAFKASKYPVERKINILKVIINVIYSDGKVTFEDAYSYLHSVDSSYQEDEVREAFELLLQPLLVLKQEKEGEYKLAISRHELRERLWLLSQIFLGPSTERVLPTKPE